LGKDNFFDLVCSKLSLLSFSSLLSLPAKLYCMRFFIIGFKNSGKTTFGKKLAAKLGLQFIDLDEQIEINEGKSIPEIYTAIGDEAFRRLEWKQLKIQVKADNVVISTGGGAPCHCDNMNLMEKYGDVVYLKVPDEILVERLLKAANDRPIVLGKTEAELREYIVDLRNKCEHHYMRARYIVSGDSPDLDKLAEQIRQNKG
jgi:shikimate kinase